MALGVSGLAPQKQVLITYPNDTPQSDLSDFKNAIISAVRLGLLIIETKLTTMSQGGEVLHEFCKPPLASTLVIYS